MNPWVTEADEALHIVASAMTEELGVPLAALRSPRRTRMYARHRQVAYYLMREITDASFPEIGRYLHKDHSTVLYGCREALTHQDVLDAARRVALRLGVVL